MRIENQSLTEMGAVGLRICQSGLQLQRHHQHGWSLHRHRGFVLQGSVRGVLVPG
jgi:hypothetical protein